MAGTDRAEADRVAFFAALEARPYEFDFYQALRRLEALEELDGDVWAAPLAAYLDEHDRIGTGPDARGPGLFLVEEGPDTWAVQQILDDPQGHHDWRIVGTVDLRASDDAGEPILSDVRLTQL